VLDAHAPRSASHSRAPRTPNGLVGVASQTPGHERCKAWRADDPRGTKGWLIRSTVPGSTPNRLQRCAHRAFQESRLHEFVCRLRGQPTRAETCSVCLGHRPRRFIGGRPGLRRQEKGGHPAACRSWWPPRCRCERHQPASRHRPAAAMLPLRQRTIHPQIDGRSVIVLLFSYAIRKLNNKGGGHGDHGV
jgi:hypothetical protein